MPSDISLRYHPILPLEAFLGLVARAGLTRISLPEGAIDAFGVIRLRTLLQREALQVAAVHRSASAAAAVADRAELLAGILNAERVVGGETGEPTLSVSRETIAADGHDLARYVATLGGGPRELDLDPAAWRDLAQAPPRTNRR